MWTQGRSQFHHSTNYRSVTQILKSDNKDRQTFPWWHLSKPYSDMLWQIPIGLNPTILNSLNTFDRGDITKMIKFEFIFNKSRLDIWTRKKFRYKHVITLIYEITVNEKICNPFDKARYKTCKLRWNGHKISNLHSQMHSLHSLTITLSIKYISFISLYTRLHIDGLVQRLW